MHKKEKQNPHDENTRIKPKNIFENTPTFTGILKKTHPSAYSKDFTIDIEKIKSISPLLQNIQYAEFTIKKDTHYIILHFRSEVDFYVALNEPSLGMRRNTAGFRQGGWKSEDRLEKATIHHLPKMCIPLTEYQEKFFTQISFPHVNLFPKHVEFKTSKRNKQYASVEFNRKLIKEDYELLDNTTFSDNKLVSGSVADKSLYKCLCCHQFGHHASKCENVNSEAIVVHIRKNVYPYHLPQLVNLFKAKSIEF